MRFLNKNAYIQTAIYGYSFCKACKCAFFLLLRNILRVAAVNMVADFVLMLGKVLSCLNYYVFVISLIPVYSCPDIRACHDYLHPISSHGILPSQFSNERTNLAIGVYIHPGLFRGHHVFRDIRHGHRDDSVLLHC